MLDKAGGCLHRGPVSFQGSHVPSLKCLSSRVAWLDLHVGWVLWKPGGGLTGGKGTVFRRPPRRLTRGVLSTK